MSKVLKFNEKFDIELHYWAFDIDDNLFYMPTQIHMDQKIGNDWVPVDVSTSKFAEVRKDTENYRIRNNSVEEAFSEFRDHGPRGDKAFIEDMKKAISNDDFGPSWSAFVECLSKGELFALITARGNEPPTYRKAIEYIIDNVLSDDEQYSMYNNCLKNVYLFDKSNSDNYDRIPKGDLSKTPLIKVYLDHCDYYGVSSDTFAKEFGASDSSNPEKAKEKALDRFIDKCNNFGAKIGAKSVSVGFSDDDIRNVNHVNKYFKEKSSILNNILHDFKLNVYDTSDRNIIGGKRSKFRQGELVEESSKVPGLESSVIPFRKWQNNVQVTNPNETPSNDNHNKSRNMIKLSTDMYKEFIYNRKG